jgi:hypothetical protein
MTAKACAIVFSTVAVGYVAYKWVTRRQERTNLNATHVSTRVHVPVQAPCAHSSAVTPRAHVPVVADPPIAPQAPRVSPRVHSSAVAPRILIRVRAHRIQIRVVIAPSTVRSRAGSGRVEQPTATPQMLRQILRLVLALHALLHSYSNPRTESHDLAENHFNQHFINTSDFLILARHSTRFNIQFIFLSQHFVLFFSRSLFYLFIYL